MKTKSLLTLLLLSVMIFVASSQEAMALGTSFTAKEYIQTSTVKLGIFNGFGGTLCQFSRRDYSTMNVVNVTGSATGVANEFCGSNALGNFIWSQAIVTDNQNVGYSPNLIYKVNYGDALYTKTYNLTSLKDGVSDTSQPMTVEQWITLRGDVAQIIHRVKFSGAGSFPTTNQFTPRFNFNPSLTQFAYGSSGSVPVMPYPSNYQVNSNENWCAYLNDGLWGVGVYTPGRTKYVATTTPNVNSVVNSYSYFPLYQGYVTQYATYMSIAGVYDLKAKFQDIKNKGYQLAYDGDFEDNQSGSPSFWTKSTVGGGSHYYHIAGAPFCYDGSKSVCLTAQSTNGVWELPYWSQVQNGVTGGATYKIKWRGMAENLINGAAGIRICEFNRDGTLLVDTGLIEASKFYGTSPNFTFYPYQIDYTTNYSTTKIEIRLQMCSLDAWARAWFDSVQFYLVNL